MNIFESKESILNAYRSYVSGFLNIKESIARSFLDSRVLQGGALWPSSLISANPSYEKGGSIDELIRRQLLHPETRNIFQKNGIPFELHFHQRIAVENYINGRNTIVTSGTGSGKSLTYFLPIVDSILRSNDFSPGIRAIIVYPMNALINSQFLEFSDYLSKSKITINKYTGTTKLQERAEILAQPPHILLTNYVMLEYIMVRSKENEAFFQKTGSKISWIVFDELHTYRGRQGSDVAVLIRKLREKIDSNPRFTGTSATMSSSTIESERKLEIANFGFKMFGVDFDENDIIEERLVRIFDKNDIDFEKIRKEISSQKFPENANLFREFELANWVEQTFSVKFDDSTKSVIRSRPKSIEEGASILADATGLPKEKCEDAIRLTFLLGNQFEYLEGKKFFEFKLHQFFSQGGSIYSTLHPPESRDYRIEGELISPKYKGDTILLPLAFCRVCGTEYYVINLNISESKVTRREFLDDPYR
ncbi:MAG: DEAD/DEAH box helicase, partial [Leptospira sp.]|nr:DEAD/DEAH box helicase [Leptospira sp.]